MKHTLSKLLSALLVAALLLSAVALAEEPFEGIEAVEPVETFEETETVEPVETVEEIEAVEAAEPVDEIVEEQSVDIVEEDTIGGDEVYTYAGETYDAAPSEAAFAAAGEIPVDAAHFPDAGFRSYILAKYDTDQNGGLSTGEIASVTEFPVAYNYPSEDVYDLTGIKLFTALESLSTNSLKIQSLDVSGFTSLKELQCDNESLASVNFDGCTSLEKLYVWNTQLTALDVRGLTSLKELRCSGDKPTALEASGHPSLNKLTCDYMQLTSLNVSNCPNLEWVNCFSNQISMLNVSGCEKLYYLRCGENRLTTLDISECPKLVSLVKAKNHSRSENSNQEHYDSGLWGLNFDIGVALITNATKASTASSAVQTLSATKNTKATAYVGSYYKIDLGGQVGKGFKSSSKKVATVNSQGVVTPKAAGKAKITFKVSGKTRTVTLTVKDNTTPKSVKLNMTGTVSAKVGDKVSLSATLSKGAVSALKWTSSDKKVATVVNGVVSFKKAGTVTITVTTVKGKKKANVKFKVK